MDVYAIRTKDRVLKAEVTERVAKNLITEFDGHWMTEASGRRVWVFDGEGGIYTANMQQLRLYVWNGDYMYKEQE